MRAVSAVRILTIGLVGWLLAAGSADAQTLRAGGTGGAIGILQRLGDAFSGKSESKVEIASSLGSGGALRALADGKLELVVSGRPLTAKEMSTGLVQVAALRTAYVFVTSHPKPNGLKSADLPQIYAGTDRTWADGTPIRIILRPPTDTDPALLAKLFPGMEPAIERARGRAEVPTAPTDQDNLALAESMPGSLTGAAAAQVVTGRNHVNPIPIDGVEPTFANFESGAYRFTKTFYLIVRQDGGADALRFVEFIRSPHATKLLRDAETLPGAE